jgi:hypothetical protein
VKTIPLFLNMTLAGTTYTFDSQGAFFPIDGMGWGNFENPSHNYNFTTETRAWFQYKGGESLEFFGDDDTWIFINKKLAVDLAACTWPSAGASCWRIPPDMNKVKSCDFPGLPG